MRGIPDKILFTGPDIYDFVADQQKKLKKAYEALPDEQALDEHFVVESKKRFMLDVPRLKPEEWTAEQKQISQHSVEVSAYIPFDGDPVVFTIRPSAMKATVARGEIVDHELLIRIRQSSQQFDVPAFVRREISEVQWRLESLGGSMEHMSQQLEITLRACMQHRRRAIENRVQISKNIGIPQRKKPEVAPEPSKPPTDAIPSCTPRNAAQCKPVQQTWDIFMSHASPDKPYVGQLVKALREAGVTVWYDDDCVAWGEPLRQAIKNGLKNSSYGIVVLSKAYLADRKWTEHEFDGLFAREKLNSFIILPVWHDVTRDEIEAYDPALADLPASSASGLLV